MSFTSRQIHLENTEDGHNKFYKMSLIIADGSSMGCLIKHYGPIGKAGSSKIEEGLAFNLKNDFADMVASKIKGGYQYTRSMPGLRRCEGLSESELETKMLAFHADHAHKLRQKIFGDSFASIIEGEPLREIREEIPPPPPPIKVYPANSIRGSW